MGIESGSPVRRIVTGHDSDGRSVVVADGSPGRVYDGLGEPGLVFTEVWNTTESPARIDRDRAEASEPALTLAPPPQGTRIRVLDIPPEQPDADLDAVFEAIGAADAHRGGDRHRSYHCTETVDYGIVLDGELILILDDSETVVGPGDIVVQRGTAHGWANRSDRPVRVAFVLIDGVYDLT